MSNNFYPYAREIITKEDNSASNTTMNTTLEISTRKSTTIQGSIDEYPNPESRKILENLTTEKNLYNPKILDRTTNKIVSEGTTSLLVDDGQDGEVKDITSKYPNMILLSVLPNTPSPLMRTSTQTENQVESDRNGSRVSVDYVFQSTKPIDMQTETPPSSADYQYYEEEDTYNYDAYDEYDPYDYDEEASTENECENISTMNNDSPNEIMENLPKNIKCKLLDQELPTKCLEHSIVGLWKYCEKVINHLTEEDIIYAINNINHSPYFGFEYDYSSLLGGIKRNCNNCSGGIISATSAMYHFITKVDLDNIASLGETGDAGTDPDATLDQANYDWQEGVKNAILAENKNMKNANISITVRMTRSFTDETSKAIFFDLNRVVFCGLIMYLYTALMLGRLDLIEQRSYLTFAGIVSIMLSLEVCIGITAAMGYPYSPHHALLPFIMIGIGVDNMFVIVESWYNLDDMTRKGHDLQHSIGETVKHAGVAITVTSLTDIFAFGVGCLTLLPGLEAFCLNCAIGIFVLYVLQLSWFLACMVLDQERIQAGRNAILPCLISKKFNTPPSATPTKTTSKNKSAQSVLMRGYVSLLESKIYKSLIVCCTFSILGLGIWGSILIKNQSDEVKHLPTDSYLRRWFETLKEDFPDLGHQIKLFTGPIDPQQDLRKIDSIMNELVEMKNEGRIVKDLDGWWIAFNRSLPGMFANSGWEESMMRLENSTTFSRLMSDFLHSSKGGKYKSDFSFNGDLECGYPAPLIAASSFDITYQKFDGPKDHIPGVNAINHLINKANLSSKIFTNGRIYGSWEIDKVIAFELMRNLLLAIICVFAITFILLSNIVASGLVLMCVLFSLVDVIGFLHFWGMTIDVLSCSNIVMSVGLCVDYSAHIAHAFLVSSGMLMSLG